MTPQDIKEAREWFEGNQPTIGSEECKCDECEWARTIIKTIDFALRLAEEMRWRDISTAPKDGTKILITNGKETEVCYWDNRLKVWQGSYYDGYDFETINGKPLLWMPRPQSNTERVMEND